MAVLAAASGKVLTFRDEIPDADITGPVTSEIKDKDYGNGVLLDYGDGWRTQYCHMRRGSISVKTGQQINRAIRWAW